MLKFLVFLVFISVAATGGAYYWRTFHPEGPELAAQEPAEKSAPALRNNRGFSGRSAEDTRAFPRERQRGRRRASERQDWAMNLSVITSVISAIAAMLQAWFTAKATRTRH